MLGFQGPFYLAYFLYIYHMAMDHHHDEIPIHNFSTDDASSIPFRYIPLELKTDYDTSVPHRHNYYEMFIFTKGAGYHDIDFTRYTISECAIHFVSPGQVHQVERELGTYGYVLLFSRDFFAMNTENKNLLFDLPFLNNNGPDPVLDLSQAEMSFFTTILSTMEVEYKNKNSLKEEMLRSYLNLLLLQSHRLYNEKHPVAKVITGSTLYKDFRILLEKNFTKEHKVMEYAEKLNVTEKTLNENIKKVTGKTASEHIFDRIILEAKRLLKHSDLTTKEIAYFLNYQDPAHFSKFFKTQTGQSPSDFREN
ncbi:MAG TPA: helix-turn-helix transcriptional regulator [Flavobacteriales bacterium]|nr:helix-turn-helix transcriptional regulator [Flavobacteriales bacterium]